MGQSGRGHHICRAGSYRGGAGHYLSAVFGFAVGNCRVRHPLFVLPAVNRKGFARLIKGLPKAGNIAMSKNSPDTRNKGDNFPVYFDFLGQQVIAPGLGRQLTV